jgi:hypothetical protein
MQPNLKFIDKAVGTDDLFWEIPCKSGIDANEIIEKYGAKTNGWSDYHGFVAKQLPDEYFEKDEFSSWLRKEFPGIKMLLSHYAPYHMYDWHVGYVRGVVINRLLKYEGEGDSHMIYSRNYDLKREESIRGNGLYKPLIELQYNEGSYYIFNAAVPHAIWNFDKDRYLLSYEFQENISTLTYTILLNKIKEKYNDVM